MKLEGDAPWVEAKIPGFSVMIARLLRGLATHGIGDITVEYKGRRWRIEEIKDEGAKRLN